MINPSGLCACGCRQRATLASQTTSRLGHIKGQPVRFIQGHQFKKSVNDGHGMNWKGGRKQHGEGYLEIYLPSHPHSRANGYVFEHVLVASQALGSALPVGAIVHHINGVRTDNQNQNLIICDSVSYHRILHVREQAREACGHPNWKKCAYCKKWSPQSDLYVPPNGGSVRHRSCFADYMREYKRNRRQTK